MFILGRQYYQKIKLIPFNKKLQSKKLIKFLAFSGVKISCTSDHVKPVIQEFNLNHKLLHAGANKCNGSKAVCQVSGSIIDLARHLSQKRALYC